MPASVTLSNGTVVTPGTTPDTVPYVDHSVRGQRAAINGGKMNGWQNVNGCQAGHAGQITSRKAGQSHRNLAVDTQVRRLGRPALLLNFSNCVHTVRSKAPANENAKLSAGRVPFRRCPDDGMNPSLREEHGEIPRRGKSPVAGLAAERESCPHGILGCPAADSSAVLPDVHADRHAVSIGQLQRLGRDLFALGRVALGVQELEIPAAMRSAVNPGDDVIDRGAARRVRQVIPAPRAAPVLRLHQFGPECQAVRCPWHNLAVVLAITSPGGKRPAAKTLPGRCRHPADTAPARLGRHEVKLTGRSDIAAVAGGGNGRRG